MKMRRNKVYRWLIALWLLIPGEYALCAYQPAMLPAAWHTKPVLSSDMKQEYQFHSTSTYPLIVGTTSYTANDSLVIGQSPRVRKTGHWDENGEWIESPEDENPIGVIDTPVGEPWVLILLVGMYMFVTVRRKTKRIAK